MILSDWDLLRVVLAISRHGGLSGAARALGVNQATVSRQLARAEEIVDTRLFDRLTAGLSPTRAGVAAIEAATRVEQQMIDLDLRLSGMTEGVNGALRVTVPMAMMDNGLADDIADFILAYPEVRVSISGDDAIISLGDRRADIAIRAQDKPAAGLWGYRLAEIEYQFFGAESLFETWGDAIAAKDPSAPIPMIDLDNRPSSFQNEFLKTYPGAEMVMYCSTLDEYLPLLRRGVGFGLCACFIAARSPGLRRVPQVTSDRSKSLWALTHPDLRTTLRYKVFMDFLRDRFAMRAEEFASPE